MLKIIKKRYNSNSNNSKIKIRNKMSKLIDQGGFGCVFYPGRECDGRTSKNPKYISKLHKKNYHVVNEYNIGKKVTSIPLYEYIILYITSGCWLLNFKFKKGRSYPLPFFVYMID